MGCRVEVFGFEATSSELRKAATVFKSIPREWCFAKREEKQEPVRADALTEPEEPEVYDPDEVQEESDEEQPVVDGQPAAPIKI